MSDFASLFRTSKFASLPVSKSLMGTQVLASERRLAGDWGLKHTLPTDLRTRQIVAKHIDDNFGRIRFSSATSNVGLVEVFKENFAYSIIRDVDRIGSNDFSPKDSSAKSIDLAMISEADFKDVLKLAKSKRHDWLLKKLNGSNETAKNFLGIETSNNWIHIPSYMHHDSSLRDDFGDHKFVTGNILQSTRHQNSRRLGIAGYIASMDNIDEQQSNRRSQKYEVSQVIVKEGAVEIKVKVAEQQDNLFVRPPENIAPSRLTDKTNSLKTFSSDSSTSSFSKSYGGFGAFGLSGSRLRLQDN
ncbi:hypothetical protein HK096_003029 [Nowakowskiella sp. JEL0078]|nr:hypothetical protein HK096_003029 [Nowakowskiella sp. JEL0078]